MSSEKIIVLYERLSREPWGVVQYIKSKEAAGRLLQRKRVDQVQALH